ncbi:MAG TPA: hypothetical protein VF594_04280 [Rubricoccaceae bacterium]
MAGLAILPPLLPDDVLARLTAWAEGSGATVRVVRLGAGRLSAAVEAFAAGHPAVLFLGVDPPPDALLDVVAAELAAPMTAVLGPDADGWVAVLGLTEIVPALLVPSLHLTDALDLAVAVGLTPVVLPAALRPETPPLGAAA